MNIKKWDQFINESTIIDGLEYPISEEDFEYISRRGSKFAYVSNNPDNWHDKKNIRVYNHNTKKHFYLEKVWPKVGDNNLLFIDFPRTDAPVDSWSSDATQYAKVTAWGSGDRGHSGDFVRFKIIEIDKDNYCRVDDGFNKPSGWYARSCFYKINKIS